MIPYKRDFITLNKYFSIIILTKPFMSSHFYNSVSLLLKPPGCKVTLLLYIDEDISMMGNFPFQVEHEKLLT